MTFTRGIFMLCLLCFSGISAVAQIALTGNIVNSNGDPIAGVTIIEKGTNRGTFSQDDGSFAITYKSEASVLIFSVLGYAKQEIAPAGKKMLSVTMVDETMQLSGVEIVGTRNLNRSATETVSPVEIIPIAQVTNSVGQLDLNQILQFVSPSFNSNRQSGSDGADHIDPATLRGLGPDQTLVLINGKRRHQSSLVNLYGTRGRGNTGTDLNTIPAAAIERIEILRDGAAAQYGSDAIAGVINIVLKTSTEEFNGNVNAGQTAENDGKNLNFNGNYGFKVGEKGGFVNVTADYQQRGHTQRDAFDVDSAGNKTQYRRKFGDAKINNFTAFFNSEMPLAGNATFYAFGGYNSRLGEAYAWSRDSNDARNVTSLYPKGFDPIIKSSIVDKSLSAGVRGKIGEWNVDFNNTIGNNTFHYYVDSSLNTSLQAKSPTRFDAGGFGQTQNTTGLSFSRNYKDFLSGLSLALGTEHRIDNYYIFAGEEGSYRNYGVIDTVINGVITPFDKSGYAAGSQGFPGFQPSNVVNAFRTNLGAYVDAELDITKSLTVAAAARFERYSDFGNAQTGKFAIRYAVTPKFALRASFNSGFRAPSLAQVYFNSIYTNVVGGKIQDQYLAQNGSNVTRTLGIPQLKQERSTSVTAGFTAKPMPGLSLTVDFYSINIKDRIALTGIFEANDSTQWGKDLKAIGVSGAQFFTNALDTRTTGLDAILTYTKNVGNGRLNVSFAANINKMDTAITVNTSAKLDGYKDIYFGKREQLFLLASAPPSKYSLVFDYKIGRFSSNLRFVRFGKIQLEDWSGKRDIYAPKVTTDLAFSYSLTENITLTLGGNNILNVYPDRQNIDTESGGNYDPVQMGYNGALFFAKLRWKF